MPVLLRIAGVDLLVCCTVNLTCVLDKITSALNIATFMKIYLNDQLVDASEAKVSVFDHGLLYGDGIFEGIRLYDGCVFKLEEHLERLEYSAKSIMLDMPWTRQQISDAVCETCRANGLNDGYIRLVVTRGIGLSLIHI